MWRDNVIIWSQRQKTQWMVALYYKPPPCQVWFSISFFVSNGTSCDHLIIGSSLPSMVIISLVEMEIWSVLIFNVGRRIHMIILLQSVTVQFRRLFWHISYYKVRQINFITKCDRLLLQSASGITKCDRLYYKVRQVLQSVTDCYYKVRQVLQSVTEFITKCVRYYKVWQSLLQNAPGITKCASYYNLIKMWGYRYWSSERGLSGSLCYALWKCK